MLADINAHLESRGLRLGEGSIVDATIIEAPSSTKNRAGERDPEMHQTRKGNQWHVGMKAHIGVGADTGIVHSMSATAANVHDVTQAPNLLRGGESVVGAMPATREWEGEGRTWDWMWNSGWRCVRETGESWSPEVGRHWWRRRRRR